MANVTAPYGQPGVAEFTLTDDYLNTVLLRGSHPILSPAVSVEAGAVIQRFQVVGFDATGKLVPATWNATPADAIKAVGVSEIGGAIGARVLYWYAGHFNSDMLVWDASFDTPAKKAAAFQGSPTPTDIRVSPRFR